MDLSLSTKCSWRCNAHILLLALIFWIFGKDSLGWDTAALNCSCCIACSSLLEMGDHAAASFQRAPGKILGLPIFKHLHINIR